MKGRYSNLTLKEEREKIKGVISLLKISLKNKEYVDKSLMNEIIDFNKYYPITYVGLRLKLIRVKNYFKYRFKWSKEIFK